MCAALRHRVARRADRRRRSRLVLRQLSRHLVEAAALQRLAMIRPAIATPDLEDVESAGDHHFFLKPREIAQFGRDQDSAGPVDRTLFRAGHHDADDVAAIRREWRMPAQILLELLPLIEGKRRHAMISLAENECVDPARSELFAIARGNTETTLRVDRVLVPASEHLTSPPSPGATPLPSRNTAVPQVRLEPVVYDLSSHFIPLEAGY